MDNSRAIQLRAYSLGEQSVDVFAADDARGARSRWIGLVRTNVERVVGPTPRRAIGSLRDETIHPEGHFDQITVGGVTYPVHAEPAGGTPGALIFHVNLSPETAAILVEKALDEQRATRGR